MYFVARARRTMAALSASALLALSSGAFAQDISDAHLKAARAAVDAINATDLYDSILPGAAAALKQQLIQKNPDLQTLISSTVDEQALTLAARRADLEKEAALAYARVMSEADLAAIAAFYQSAAGKKLLSDGPIISREVSKAADIWQRGIARDLAVAVGEKLAASVPKPVLPPEAPAPKAN